MFIATASLYGHSFVPYLSLFFFFFVGRLVPISYVFRSS